MKVKDLFSWALASCLFMACGMDRDPASPQEDLSELRQHQKEAMKRKDYVEAARIRFMINHRTELEAAGQDAEEIQNVNRRYKILEHVLEEEIAEYEKDPKQDEASFEERVRNGIQGRETTEVYQGPDFVGAYDPLVLEQEKRVYKDFGPLYVNVTKGGNGAVAVTVDRPWAGFWYPFGNNTSLYVGEDSPLAKWDAVLKKKKIKSNSAGTEAERYRGFRPDSWEGLCDALAAASIMTPEPLQPKTVEGIVFSPADQKALLTFSHLKYPRTVYGISYRGNVETDGTYQDIKPGALHQIVTTVLGVEKRAVVIDDVAGIQVWNKGLYHYRWKVEQDPKSDYIFNVKADALLIKERSKETDVPTGQGSNDIMAPRYTYRLYVDKKDVKDGKYRVIASQWTGDSFRDHPDTVSYLHKTGEPLSHNEEFNKNISIFKDLFMKPSSSIR